MTVYADDLILGGTAFDGEAVVQYDGDYSDDILYMPPFVEIVYTGNAVRMVHYMKMRA